MTTFKSGALALAIIAMLAALPVSAKKADVVLETPGADETLIYILREGRFTGWNAKMWIAVNDKTVARVKNEDYAIVRAKAGRITLNLATTGVVLSAIAIDDRPGETVFLQWRLGDPQLTEIDETAALKFMKKAKRTDPIDEVLPNNEEAAALINLSRLGYDFMQPASGEVVPDENNATITFLRRGDAKQLVFGIWGQDGYVGSLAVEEAMTISVSAGEHFFLAGNVGKTLLKLEAEAGKRYFTWLDFGTWVARVRLTPIALTEAKDLEKWLSDVDWVERNPEPMSASTHERELIVTELIQRAVEKARTGEPEFTLLSTDHAY
jgi:hypothetical protein